MTASWTLTPSKVSRNPLLVGLGFFGLVQEAQELLGVLVGVGVVHGCGAAQARDWCQRGLSSNVPFLVIRYCLSAGRKSRVRAGSPFSLPSASVWRRTTYHCHTGNLKVRKSPAATNSSGRQRQRNSSRQGGLQPTWSDTAVFLKLALTENLGVRTGGWQHPACQRTGER